jgi:hypothetical protein
MAVNQTPTNSTLTAIQTKVRRITRSPSEAQLSTFDLNQYINTSVLYDFPETLRLFNLRTNFTFYTQPNVDTYQSTTSDPNDPLYDFTNRYITVHPPVYVAGIQIMYTQSQQQFFSYWPENQFMTTVGMGDGVTTAFSGTLSTFPVLQNEVNFTSIDSTGEGLVLADYPASNTTGALGVPNKSQTLPSPFGQINYITGAFTLNFPTAPGPNIPVKCQAWPYRPAIPTIMLFFDGKFQLRPVPDQVYRVQMEVYAQPVQLLASGDVPALSEWWQYISMLTSKKIFEDRMDMESVQLIMPELKNQERLILRRTLVQQSNERASTIYNYGSSNVPFNWGNNYWGTF